MDRRNFLALATAGIVATVSIPAIAKPSNPPFTTWVPQDFVCPICKTKNTFQVWASYGSYIYSWPSKYQWVFWPWTDSPSVYLCKQCHLATFLGEFDTLPAEKLPIIKKELERIPFERKFKDYMEIPMTDRLDIAAKVYASLPDRDDVFWNHFYRIQGYHYGQSDQPEKAKAARAKALALTQKMMADSPPKIPLKELLYISGAMKHFMNDDKGAVEDFNKALTTKFVDPTIKPEEQKNGEDGMNLRLKDYIEQVKSDKPPRLADAG